jgi:hypothetical protein
MFGPQATDERGGDVSDVVFPCGQTMGSNGDTRSPLLRSGGFLHGAGNGERTLYARMAGLSCRLRNTEYL